ncbi:MAG: hypothetical protein H7Y32_14375 [Chloroflexales bacterium]|nr:hypothetical protein [Chloroflexales bacterium]
MSPSLLLARLFDLAEARWESARSQRLVALALVWSFIGALALIELRRRGLLPSSVSGLVASNHFYAVDITFKLLLVVELAGLCFGLAHSVANAVGKQFEILSLILLRETFKEFTAFDEPITWTQVQPTIMPILAEAAGALLVFVILGFYYRTQRHRPITEDANTLASFVTTKKCIGLGLLAVFALIGGYALTQFVVVGRVVAFFDACYTVLIFADVLVVLVSLRYSSTYHVVFRNSGFAIATVLIRLALIAPAPINALLGVSSALFALGLTVAYNAFAPLLDPPHGAHAPVEVVAPVVENGQLHTAAEAQRTQR